MKKYLAQRYDLNEGTAHYFETEKEAEQWLKNNGGGSVWKFFKEIIGKRENIS
ncbi:MAG: hypothetical protein HYR79_05510 [Nitrospirae bacterium]|nr:hypothetical protein [Nitrospirota bacterium]